MAYYASFELAYDLSEAHDIDIEKLKSAIYALNIFTDDYEIGDGSLAFIGYAPWDDYDADMIKISKVFPDVLFTLDGIGDALRDIWRCYYKSGRMQRSPAKITYDEYDPKALREYDGGEDLKPWGEETMNLVCPYCQSAFDDGLAWVHGEYRLPKYCPDCGHSIRLEEEY